MRRLRNFDALTGVLAAALALGTAELMAGLTASNSLIVSVGDVIVDYTPGPVVKAVIDALGTNDKPFLLASVVVISLVLGALLGPLARRQEYVGLAAFAGFGLVGALAGARDPFSSDLVSFFNATLAAFVGWWAFGRLLEAATLMPVAASDDPAAVMPGRGLADRRRFLTFAGAAVGGTALTAFTGRGVLGSGVDVEEQRQSVVLPATTVTTPVPTTAGIPVEGQSSLITPNDEFYRIDTALVVPRVDVGDWTLRIKGMVDEPYELDFDELVEMASIEESVTLACVSNQVGDDLVGNAIWLGVPLAALLERAGLQDGATQVVGRSVDGFTVGFPTEVALDGRPAMVAIGMNGEPLPADHGFPARLVVPGLYGYVSATKWLSEIELTRLDKFDGYWIPRGWSKFAPIKTQSRVDVPRGGQEVAAGRQPIAGVAWGGIRSIERVEVRVASIEGDVGEWREARLGEKLTQSSWRQWVLDWDAVPGTYNIEVRATDGNGDTQTAAKHEPAPSGATGYHRIRVYVEGA
jgi:DMSO/TMAO reductase YedYZ molybdopterin-dependent catalytic subunit